MRSGRKTLICAMLAAACVAAQSAELEQGTVRWKHELGAGVSASATVLERIGDVPLVIVGDLGGTIHALNAANGKSVWSRDVGEAVHNAPAPLQGSSTGVVVALPSGRVISLDTEDGATRWAHVIGEEIVAAPSVTRDGRVIIGTRTGRVYTLEEEAGGEDREIAVRETEIVRAGGPIWHASVADAEGKMTTTVQDTGQSVVVYLEGAEGWHEEEVFELGELPSARPVRDREGRLFYAKRGEFVAYDAGGRTSTAVLPNGKPAGVSVTGDGETAWVAGTGRDDSTWLVRMDVTDEGVERSAVTMLHEQARATGAPVPGPEGNVYVAMSDGTIIATDAQGTLIWRETTLRRTSASPVVAHSAVFIGDRSGTVVAVETGERADRAPSEEWPTLGQNAQRSGQAGLDYLLPGEIIEKPDTGSWRRVVVKPVGEVHGHVDDMEPKGTRGRGGVWAADGGTYSVTVCRTMQPALTIVTQGEQEHAGMRTTLSVPREEAESEGPCQQGMVIAGNPRTVRVVRVPVVRRNVGEPIPVPRHASMDKLQAAGPKVHRMLSDGEAEELREAKPLVWHAATRTLYAAATGFWMVRWPTEQGTTIVTRVRVMWPEGGSGKVQQHIAGTPAVSIADEEMEEFAFEWSDNRWDRLEGGQFERTDAGRTVLAIGSSKERPGEGNSLSFLAVESRDPDQMAQAAQVHRTLVGQAIEPPGHDTATGAPWVRNARARVNTDEGYYDSEERTGPIIPVNTGDELELVLYEAGSARIEANPEGPGRYGAPGWEDAERFYGKPHGESWTEVTQRKRSTEAWPVEIARYRPAWPTNEDVGATLEPLVIAKTLKVGYALDEPYRLAKVYGQGNVGEPGYNPNEEHAWVAHGTLWALRSDLNRRDTSEAFTLLAYDDPDRGRAMAVVPIRAATPEHEFAMHTTVGEVEMPTPLENLGEDGKVWQQPLDLGEVYRDRTGDLWAYRAGHHGEPIEIETAYCYRPRKKFDTPGDARTHRCPWASDLVGWLSTRNERARRQIGLAPTRSGDPRPPLALRTVVGWPEKVAVLRQGQALTSARLDGELPALYGHVSVRILYQQSEHAGGERRPSVELIDIASPRSVPWKERLPDTARPERIKSESRFKDLPKPLNEQVVYDHSTSELVVRGRYVSADGKRIKSSPEKGVEFVLPNVLGQSERDTVSNALEEAAKSDARFGTAVRRLLAQASAPMRITDSEAVTAHPALSPTGAEHVGYVSYMVDDSEAAGDAGRKPKLRILRVSAETEPAEIIVVAQEDNPFAELVYLRHSADLGGRSEEYEVRWENAFAVGDRNPQEHEWSVMRASGDVAEVLRGREQLKDQFVRTRVRRKGHTQWGAPSATRRVDGWLARVVEGVSSFDTIVKNFREREPELATGIIERAGPPYRAPVALTSDVTSKEPGLVEVYETVFRRGRALGLAQMNEEMQTYAARLVDLYLALANDAYADAADPLLMIPVKRGQDGAAVESAAHAFAGQTDSLLEEELALLRGIGADSADIRRYPVYNRLRWNFSDSDVQALYVANYAIHPEESERQEKASQGKNVSITEHDARRQYPKGHGDAYGHFLSALKVYYSLLLDRDFRWTTGRRFEDVAGEAVTIDDFDERKFAQAALGRVRTGLDVLDLTHKRHYKAGKDGTLDLERTVVTSNTDEVTAPAMRSGEGDWASRVGQGAYLDWVLANALLPAEHETKHGLLGRLNRESVPELGQLAAAGETVQRRLDAISLGRHPLGVPGSIVPFNWDLERQINQGKSAFELALERTENALKRAEEAQRETIIARSELRRIVNEGRTVKETLGDDEFGLESRLIEMFGTPFGSDIEAGKSDDGPDLDNFHCMPASELAGGEANTVVVQEFGTGQTIGARITLPARCVKHDPTDTRRVTGAIQTAAREIARAKGHADSALQHYSALLARIEAARDEMVLTADVHAREIRLLVDKAGNTKTLNESILEKRRLQGVAEALSRTSLAAARMAESIIPRGVGFTAGFSVGTWVDAFGPLRVAAMAAGHGVSEIALGTSLGLQIRALGEQNAKEMLHLAAEVKRVQLGHELSKSALGQRLEELVRLEPEMRLAVLIRIEALQQGIENYRNTCEQAQRLLQERHRRRTFAETEAEQLRYRDMAVRLLREDAVERYRRAFEEAQMEVYLLIRQHDFETSYAPNDPRLVAPGLYDRVLRARTLRGGTKRGTRNGLREVVDDVVRAHEAFRGRAGAPKRYVEVADLHQGLFRIGYYAEPGSAPRPRAAQWRDALRAHVFRDVRAFADLKDCCVDLERKDGPFLIVPFDTPLTLSANNEYNHFGHLIDANKGPQSGFRNTYTGSVVEGIRILFYEYPATQLVANPKAYLVAAGEDMFRSPSIPGRERELPHVRGWAIASGVGARTTPEFGGGTVYGSLLWGKRQATEIAAEYHGRRTGHPSEKSDDTLTRQHYGRSIHNTRWYLIVPIGSLAPGEASEEILRRLLGEDGEGDGGGLAGIGIEFHVRARE